MASGFFFNLRCRLFFDRYSLVQFYRQMSALVNAGFGGLRALQTCEKQTSEPRLRMVQKQIINLLDEGRPLSEAVKDTRGVFTGFHSSMLKAAETSGNLPEILNKLSDYEEKEMNLNRRLKSATTYPACVFIISVITIVVLMRFLAPLLNTLTDALSGEIPWPTKIVMYMSQAVSSIYFYVALLVLGFLFHIFYKTYTADKKGRYKLDRFKLKVPFYGDLQKKVIIIRTCRVMQTLLDSGVPAALTLELLGEVADNYYYKDRVIGSIAFKVNEGNTLTDSFTQTGFFPGVVTSMIKIGEESGTLPMVLNRLARIYEFDVDIAMSTFYAALEPVLIIIMGLITFLILAAAFLPIYKLIGTIGN